MVRLASKLFLLTVIVFLVANALAYGVLSSAWLSSFFGVRKIGGEVYAAIDKSRGAHDAEYVVLGDSVAHQVFSVVDEKAQGILNLTSNQAVTMAGQYLLACNALRSGRKVKGVLLYYLPNSFVNDLDEKFTFNYFVKPFYNAMSAGLLTAHTRARIKSKPYSFLYQLPIARVLPVFSQIDYTDASRPKFIYLSPTSIEYLQLMKQLCKDKGIPFSVYPLPISAGNFSSYNYDYMKSQIKSNALENVFANYFDAMVVLDNSFFVEDTIHYKSAYVPFVSSVALRSSPVMVPE